MDMKKSIKAFLIVALTAVAIIGCKKEPDSPPVKKLDGNSIITIDSLRAWQRQAGGPITFDDSLSLYGTVVMDETNGNIYKNIYLQDNGVGLNVRFTSSTDLLEGDYIRIALGQTILSSFNGVIQLGEVDEQENVVVQKKGAAIEPTVITIPALKEAYNAYLSAVATDDFGADFKLQSTLIKFENVQFKVSELDKTYADPINQSSENRTFEDFEGNTLFIRTSGFADFAGDTLPEGSGSMICIVSEFNNELQLILRSPEEAALNNPRGPGEILVKDFDDDNVLSGGWLAQSVIGTDTWETSTLGGAPNPYGVISNYTDGDNFECENWLISPALDLSTSTAANLSFDNAYNFGGPTLELLVSTNYAGTGDPNSATWTPLSATWSGGGFTWVNSGIIDLSAYLGGTLRIAFKYTGTDFNGSTWELDNIIING